MPKFSTGDRVRLSAEISPALLGVGKDATCAVVQSRRSYCRGLAGEIDIQLPNGIVIKSLPAARFEHAIQIEITELPQDLPLHRSRRGKVVRRLHFIEHQGS